MQTHLHGRDMITTQEWTKDELDTIIDVALDLKRRRALAESSDRVTPMVPASCIRRRIEALQSIVKH